MKQAKDRYYSGDHARATAKHFCGLQTARRVVAKFASDGVYLAYVQRSAHSVDLYFVEIGGRKYGVK